ncbi:MAG: hypothetical protein WA718_23125 [Terriglobales bacterium]
MSNAPQAVAETLVKLDALVEQNKLLEKQNKELMDQIGLLRQTLAKQNSGEPLSAGTAAVAISTVPGAGNTSEQQAENDILSGDPSAEPEKKSFGIYTPGAGFKVADTKYGDLSISAVTYLRYLNQLDLNPYYTNSFGVTSTVKQRQDLQLNKAFIKFLGWVVDPKFRYLLYVWTSNATMGQGAQVVVAGNLRYIFNKHFTLAAGINGLPGVRTTEGNWPYWLPVDSRQIADEFFRPSYTTGIWGMGEITPKLKYQAMIGNNLSQLGVNANQLPNHFNTIATALVWMPTTGEFGAGFGDYENHATLATRLGAHYSRSDENKQSQPNTQTFENVQIRLTDGTIVFTPNLFGQGLTVTDVDYQMTSFDGGIKRHGYALEGEYYMRWLSNFRDPAPMGLPTIFNNGFQVLASAMVVPKSFQVYVGGSKIFGKTGDPWDSRAGVNYYPFKNRVIWWNNEMIYLSRSPVGYTSVPYAFGSKGWVYDSNLVLNF